MSALIGIAVAIWVISGVLGYGMTFAYFQRRWPQFARECVHEDMLLGLLMGLIGPIGLVFTFLKSNRAAFGLKYRP